MNPNHWDLQKYLVFSDRVTSEADTYIRENFPDQVFVGIHLRNGADWVCYWYTFYNFFPIKLCSVGLIL